MNYNKEASGELKLREKLLVMLPLVTYIVLKNLCTNIKDEMEIISAYGGI